MIVAFWLVNSIDTIKIKLHSTLCFGLTHKWIFLCNYLKCHKLIQFNLNHKVIHDITCRSSLIQNSVVINSSQRIKIQWLCVVFKTTLCHRQNLLLNLTYQNSRIFPSRQHLIILIIMVIIIL